MINEMINTTGWVKIQHLDKSGIIIDQREFKNMIVTTGKDFIASRMAGNTPAVMSHIAVGTGTTTPAVGNTALQTEIGRGILTSVAVSGNTVTYTSSIDAGVGTGAVSEAAIFNNASAGTMLARTVFPVVNKAVDDTIVIIWSVTNS